MFYYSGYIYSSIPEDESGNGGGFVFDCRFIHNPGKKDEYKFLTGKDAPVIEFLDSQTDMQNFLINVYNIADRAIEVYEERGFTDIMFSFGCTGGQHRSVYSAEHFYNHILQKFPQIIAELNHKELI